MYYEIKNGNKRPRWIFGLGYRVYLLLTPADVVALWRRLPCTGWHEKILRVFARHTSALDPVTRPNYYYYYYTTRYIRHARGVTDLYCSSVDVCAAFGPQRTKTTIFKIHNSIHIYYYIPKIHVDSENRIVYIFFFLDRTLSFSGRTLCVVCVIRLKKIIRVWNSTRGLFCTLSYIFCITKLARACETT